MTEKELRELEKFAKENGYNEELKDIYLRKVLDKNKNTNKSKFSAKYSISYKHTFS